MKLKFIGKDGSMGLVHGAVCDCNLISGRNEIYVCWNDDITGYRCCCPYSNLTRFLENWEEVSNL